ncbi:hypothetical protein L3Q82_001479 [Scortum barcoo]|uniref:Uncharacterized protein n=1 Tax=Scortum barcoo TaxID=214431 RepID=A0ACB8W829_9TELE|nr:hypothetical protein L3Q82_001479 [Scortum barcoo]
MARLELILIFLLQFQAGINGNPTYLYKRVGEDVILPCASESSSVTTCSTVKWLYNRESLYTFTEAEGVNVRRSSPRADRLNLDSDCSLIISKITAEDFGLYTCRQGTEVSQDVNIHLSVLTISPSQPDGDPKRDDEVTLQCSLSKYSDPSLQMFSIRWLDETGTVLLGKDFGYESLHSVLTVKRQSGNNRRYTCQLVDQKNNVKTEADYTTVFTDSTVWSPLSCVMLTLLIAGVILLIVITGIIIRWYTKRLADHNNVRDDCNEVMYENINTSPHLMLRPSKVHNDCDDVMYENMACLTAKAGLVPQRAPGH